MIVIRRMVDRRRAYTAIFLKGEPPKIFPTSDAEHARILQVYKQDRPHEGILNDFSDETFPPLVPASRATAQPAAKKRLSPKSTKPAPRITRRPKARPLWIVPVEPVNSSH
jgi:hypothetical protein